MRTDRELLELAAKAAGLEYHWIKVEGGWLMQASEPGSRSEGSWNPLTNDGDVLRLAVKLFIVPDFRAASETIPAHIYANLPKRNRGWVDGKPTWVSAEYVPEEMWRTGREEDQRFANWYMAEYSGVVRGVESAARRAIVLAAAEIGAGMP